MSAGAVISTSVAAGIAAAEVVEQMNLLKKKKFIIEKIINKKKGDNKMYDIIVSLMGKEVKVLTIMGVVPGKVTEVTDSTVTLVHKHYRQVVNIDYIITITEKTI